MKKELTYRKNGFLLLLLFGGLIVLSGCRKDKKNSMGFEINAYLPHTNDPVSGVKWKVIERKYKGISKGHEATGWTIEGETDVNGFSNEEIIPFKNLDYTYIIEFDYSSMNLPLGEYSITKGPTSYALLHREPASENSFEIRVLPMMSTQFNFKNLTCFDTNDTFRYKSYNADEKQYPVTQGTLDSWPWLEGPSFIGCVDITGTFAERLAGHYVFHWEAVRNGILETGVDTFFVASGVNSTINMYW